MQLPATRTPISPLALFRALRDAGIPPRGALVLVAQWGIETGDGRACWNHNFGNVKRVAGEHWTALHNVVEYLGQPPRKVVFNPPHEACNFAAFKDFGAGLAFYLRTIRHKFASAWRAVEAGDPALFAALLKQARYYTAPLDDTEIGGVRVPGYRPAMIAKCNALRRTLGPALQIEALGFPSASDYQAARGLAVDGVIGPKTRAALVADSAPDPFA